MPHKLILAVRCPSAAGQVASIAAFLDQRGGYVDEISVFDSPDNQTFFVRCVFHLVQPQAPMLDALRADFRAVADRFAMEWAIHDADERARVLIMVSRYDHCLNDLLYRWRIGELRIDIVGIVSNHRDLEPIAAAHGLPFHHLPVTPENKHAQERRLLELMAQGGAEVVVLARYMQVLSIDMCRELEGRAINIHHSFLPGFKGAKPYQQAYERGVKVIGATAHYVTSDLDEGPIIAQVVQEVDHTAGVEQLQAIGRDMECLALSRALKLHIERRVFLNGRKTVVLR